MEGSAWQGEEYAPQAAHHRSLDDWFLDAHRPAADDVVVDAGCGTGEFTVRLAELATAGRVIGVDSDESMLDVARRTTGPNIEFRRGTLQALDRVCERESADLVVSRAALHWLELADYPDCFAAVRRVLKPGGWLHTESGAAGNVYDVRALMDDVAGAHGLPPAAVSFPDPGIVMEMLEETGFDVGEEGVTTVAQRRRFGRHQLLGFLRTQAAQAYVANASPALRQVFLDEVATRVDELVRHDGTYDQTFVRLHVLCRRPVG